MSGFRDLLNEYSLILALSITVSAKVGVHFVHLLFVVAIVGRWGGDARGGVMYAWGSSNSPLPF